MYTYHFKVLVAKFIDYKPSSGKYDENKMRELTDEFETTPSTVIRWIAGKANPHESIKKLVIRYIQDKETGG